MNIALIDGTYQICRSVHADKNLFDAHGHIGSPAYKFLNMMWNFKDIGQVVMVFDHEHSAYRKDIFPGYKVKETGNETQDDLNRKERAREAINYTEFLLHKILPGMGIPIVKVPHQEGDDVLFHLALHFKSQNHNVTVVTDDGDFSQFIQHGIKIYKPMKGEHLNEKNFVETQGYKPEYFCLWKAMVGDSSDCIPGVHRVGPKTATKILNEIDSTDIMEFYKWARAGNKSMHKNLLAGMAILKRNLMLIDISKAPLTTQEVVRVLENSLSKTTVDVNKTMELFKTNGFRTLGKWLSYLNQIRGAESVKHRLSIQGS